MVLLEKPWRISRAVASSRPDRRTPERSSRVPRLGDAGTGGGNEDCSGELFLAATEVVEAIVNALLASEPLEGNGHRVPGLDAASLQAALRQAGWPGATRLARDGLTVLSETSVATR
ncbi:hypothetical protein D9M68_847180 [compost metagenome]